MAHQIFEHDSLLLHKERAWHGLGTIVETAPTVPEALTMANLDWTVDQRKLVTNYEGTMIEIPDRVANIRSDTGEVLGIVGNAYQVFQNRELAAFIEGVVGDDGVGRIESAGSLRNGRDVFFLLKNSSFAVRQGVDDQVNTFTLFRTTHDGSASFRALGTSVRVVCANTLNFALRGSRADQGIAIRHTRSLLDRVDEAREALGIAAKKAEEFQESLQVLARTEWSEAKLKQFFADVYEKANGAIPVNPKTDKESRQKLRAVSTLAKWLDNLDNDRNAIPGISGTAWASFNAVTEWADHVRTVRTGADNSDARDARTFSNIFGTSAAFKQEALAVALGAV